MTLWPRNIGGAEIPSASAFRVRGSGGKLLVGPKSSKNKTAGMVPSPFFYAPAPQNFSAGADLNIRTRLPAETVAAALAREVHALDANLAPYEVISLQEQMERSTSPQRGAV